MEEWKEYKLSDIAALSTGFPFDGHKYAKEGIRVVRGDNVTIGSLRWDTDKDKRWNEPFNRASEYSLRADDIVIGMDGSRVGKNRAKVKQEDLPLYIAQRVACIRHNDLSLQSFLYYQIFSQDFENYIKAVQTGTSIPHVSLKQIGDYPVLLPSLKVQQIIADILKSLDDKIEVNKRLNDNLQHQANALFKLWFVDFELFRDTGLVETEMGMIPKGWQVVSLISIAKYLNGLAMQNFRPEGNDKGLPVLKIKELGQGMSDSSSDRCSSDIDKQYIVTDGDVIFSWSGTLLVDLWCGGQCGLNQHLFKVSSKDYPKWFYYMWTKQHLNNFIQIAKDKAVTMGHIKRGHLEEAKVLVPTESAMNTMTAIMQPIIDEIIDSRIESRRLSQLRDALLPRLMSGELKVDSLTDE